MSKSVLLVITGLAMGGAESQVVNLADELSRRGYQVTLAYMLKPAVVSPGSLKVKVVWLGGRKTVVGMFITFFNLLSLVYKVKPNIVHSHMFHANILSRLVRILSNIPCLVCTAHNTNEGGKLRMFVYRLTDRLADQFTNVSQEAVEAFEEKKAAPAGRMLTMHNGIDTQRFSFDSRVRQKWRSDLGVQNLKVFIAIGRFHEQKDYPNLLNSFSMLGKDLEESYLLIVGDGELRPQIECQVAKLGLQDKVALLGVRKDVPELLSAADIFVLSSAWEGFGLVVAEAMAAERIVIATDSGGVAEVMGCNGFLVAPRDTPALAASMKKAVDMHDDQAREIGRAARQHIVENFGLNNVVDRWLKLYNK